MRWTYLPAARRSADGDAGALRGRQGRRRRADDDALTMRLAHAPCSGVDARARACSGRAASRDARSRIGPGLLVLAGIGDDDAPEDRDWLARKIVQLRVFDDDAGVMNRSVLETGGELLVVSQFTLLRVDAQGQSAVVRGRRAARGRAPGVRRVRRRALGAARQARADRRVRRDDAGRAGQRRAGDDLAGFAAREARDPAERELTLADDVAPARRSRPLDVARALRLQQRPQHPRVLLVDLHALRQQVRRRLVVRLVDRPGRSSARCARRPRCLRRAGAPSPRPSAGPASPDRGELGVLGVRRRRRVPERADALGDRVGRRPQLVVLRLEHEMQRVEHRAGDVPVEVVRLQVDGEGVREQARQPCRDLRSRSFALMPVSIAGARDFALLSCSLSSNGRCGPCIEG